MQSDWVEGLSRRPVRLVLVVLGTVVLGAVLAVVKGRDYGLGYFVGNLSVPYLVAAFFAGRLAQRWWAACAVGVLATWATLAGFYASAEAVFGYPTGSMTRFYLEWFLAGGVSGVVMGAVGRASRARRWLGYALPLALVGEPFAVAIVQLAGRFGGFHPGPLQLLAWSSEALLGVVIVALTARLRRGRAAELKGTQSVISG